MSDTIVSARNTGMNKSVLIPAFTEPNMRDECYANDHIIIQHGKCCEGKTQDAMKRV